MEIKTIKNTFPSISTVVTLKSPIVDVCPRSHEPQEGSYLSVEYVPDDSLIELHALEEFIKWASQSNSPMDLETLAQILLQSCQKALPDSKINVIAFYKLKNGVEILCQCQS